MKPTLTIASSLTPHLPWWRNVSMPSAMVEKAVSMVTRNIAERAPKSGVAVVIRVPHPEQGVSFHLDIAEGQRADTRPVISERIEGMRNRLRTPR